jgi:hypothetical protein
MHFGVHIRMNKIITTTIALAVASTTSFAHGGSWLELDKDIASLSSTANVAGGTEVGGLLRSSYRDGEGVDGADSEFGFEDVMLHVGGSLEEFTWRVSADLTDGLSLDDANVTWNQSENLSVTWGQQKLPMFRSSSMDQESMLFIDRSLLGTMYDTYDMGVSISGSNSGLDWTLAAVNGTGLNLDLDTTPGDGIPDGINDTDDSESLTMFAHVAYTIGNGACTCCDGALHGGEGMDATIGVSYMDEQDDSIDAVLGIDFAMTMGQFSLMIELADGDDDNVGALGDAPNAVTFGYLFADNMEAAYRHEDRDTATNDSKDTFGLNYYLHGHNAKWQINYIDDDALTDQVIAIGLTVGKSR